MEDNLDSCRQRCTKKCKETNGATMTWRIMDTDGNVEVDRGEGSTLAYYCYNNQVIDKIIISLFFIVFFLMFALFIYLAIRQKNKTKKLKENKTV